ncbi:MAG TPA: PEP-CTERM sorting domain-containing protein [Vicinamibacterales bacterium]|jgi:hypothetical protein
MRVASRIAVLTILTVVFSARGALASVITVAEFSWTSTLIDPSPNCDPTDTACIPDPLFQSVFLLTNLWDGPDPGPTLQGSRLTLPDGESVWFDLAPPNDPTGTNIDQISIVDVLPLFADATIGFAFAGEDYALTRSLSAPDTSAVFSIEVPDTPPAPVPEPGTLGLLSLGVVAGLSRVRHTRLSRA